MSIAASLAEAFNLSSPRCSFINERWLQFNQQPIQGILEFPGSQGTETDLSLCYSLESFDRDVIESLNYLSSDLKQLQSYDLKLGNLWLEYDGDNLTPSWYLQFTDEYKAIQQLANPKSSFSKTSNILQSLPAATGLRYIAKMESRQESCLRFVFEQFPLTELPCFLKKQHVTQLSLNFLKTVENLSKHSARTQVIYSAGKPESVGIEICELSFIQQHREQLESFHKDFKQDLTLKTAADDRLICQINHLKYSWADVRQESEPSLKTYCSFSPITTGLNPDTW